eukprot:CAMPEP_0204587002 /NCGR_PEP_ID=MMETSP0661-20131031/47811_1 /ASSEMBLY_ACC=CAM_ASM_000606 /TAXON_ID=109239 /ORGANISM="Alexandrium margalefi, Strain AMGDE01CS-322" /LENGTH=87 /DNA_ID=CAMNT_0051596687 /DNA_START=82 /DNA_END=345 /DNA_ORIENTATION=+
MASTPASMIQLTHDGPKSMSEAVRETFKTDLKEAAMLDYIPARAPAVSCASSVPVVGTFGTWYVSRPVDFVAGAPKPKMDAYMTAAL